MHVYSAPTAQNTARSSTRRGRIALAIALVVALMSPALASAQQTMNAPAVTSEGIALTATELGPEWSMIDHHTTTYPDGLTDYMVRYSSPSGREVRLVTGVLPSPEIAESLISNLRYDLEAEGATITSVQSDGFGDGRAFKFQASNKKTIFIGYLFRVRNLVAEVGYSGAASAGDTQTLALATARKQETKLFAAFAPPPPPPVAPTAVPTPMPIPTPVPTPTPEPVSAAPITIAPQPATPPTLPYCSPGEQPQFHLGFATLSAQLGPRMGNPTSCEYADPSGSGDTLQNTDAGQARYRSNTDTATFTIGSEHWALTASGIVYWTGDSLDPVDGAVAFGG